MRSRSFFVILLGVILALLSIGVGGFYLLVLRDPAMRLQQSTEPIPAAIMFIPQRAPLVLALQASPESIEAYEQAGLTADERRSLHQSFLQFKQNLLAGTGIHYTQDIRPWLGDEITAAVVSDDFDQNLANGRQPGYLLALSIQDLSRAQEFLQLFWEKRILAGVTPQLEQYAGVKITADGSLATAQFGDRFVLLSNSAKVLRQALNAVQVPEYSLSHRETVVSAIRQLPTDRVGVLYTSQDEVQEFLDFDDGVEPSASGEGVVAAIALSNSGVRIDGRGVVSTTAAAFAPVQPAPLSMASLEPVMGYVPKRSAVALFGSDTHQLFNPTSTLHRQLVSTRLQKWRDHWQSLLMPEGVAPTSGSYVLALLENRPNPEWIFASHPSSDVPENQEAPSEWMDALDKAGQEQGLNVVTLPLGDRTITAWTRIESNIVPLSTQRQKSLSAVTEDVIFDAEVEGVYTLIDQVVLVASSPKAMNTALSADSLYRAGGIQQVLQELPSAATGYLYVNGRSLQTMLEERLGLETAFARTQPLSGAIRSLTLSSDRPSREIGVIKLQPS